MQRWEGGIWIPKPPMPVDVTEIGVGEVSGKIYVVGGGARTEPDGEIPVAATNVMYDPDADRWQDCAPLPLPLTHVGVTGMGGKLYAIGGFTADVHLNPVNLAFVYDPRADEWSELPRFSSPRGSVAAVAVDGKIHIIGGRRSDKVIKISLTEVPGAPEMFEGLGTVTTHEEYDPDTGRWSLRTPLPGPTRDHLGFVVLEGRIHVLGGRINDFDIVDRHDVYDPGTDSWISAAPLPGARSAGAAAVLDGLILYAGGECKPGCLPGTPNTFEDVHAYDPRADRWIRLPDLPQGGRHGFGAATVGRRAFFAGGSPLCGGGASADLVALSLDPMENFYGNTVTVTGAEGTSKIWFKPDHTFSGIDEQGVRIDGAWQRTGNELCSIVKSPAPKPPHYATLGTHRVGDQWEDTRRNGDKVSVSLSAGR